MRDLDRVATFYTTVIGLSPIENTSGRVTLGNGIAPLLELVGDAALAANDRRQAGLFHTAFLLPSRTDLDRWLAHAVATRVPLQGASDHVVSEAIYLADPEGNGIEVYADRPVSLWRGPNGQVQMPSDPLDAQELITAVDGTEWLGFPENGMIGHVHLQVGDTTQADGFYRDVLGLKLTAHYPGANFYSSRDYHHQLAGNVWNSRRRNKASGRMGGLDAVEIVVRDTADLATIAERAETAGIDINRDGDRMTLQDPWGTAITLSN